MDVNNSFYSSVIFWWKLFLVSVTPKHRKAKTRKTYRGWKVAVGLGLGGRNVGQVLDHFLRVLRLPGPGLSSAENTLVLTILKQIN